MSAPAFLPLLHGDLPLPAYLPDATLGVVRAVDAGDLTALDVPAVMMNVFHLMQKPGSSTIAALGGLHRMAGWMKPIITDSGGFQAYSLIRQNAKFGRLTDKGLTFQPEGAARKFQLTPEKSVQLQLAYGADVVICLDDCTHVDAPAGEQALSVARTIAWAKRCRAEFDRQLAQRKGPSGRRPLLFAVIQGGGDLALRRQCAEALLEIGFDGYGYGGWPLDSHNRLLTDLLTYTRELVPAHWPLHALGVGHPQSVLACFRLGYAICDSALPTRDARHGRLYTFTAPPAAARLTHADWFAYLYVEDRKHIKTAGPISPHCDCYTCRRYSLGYLHHLYKAGETLFYRLATLHNLHFMQTLVANYSETA